MYGFVCDLGFQFGQGCVLGFQVWFSFLEIGFTFFVSSVVFGSLFELNGREQRSSLVLDVQKFDLVFVFVLLRVYVVLEVVLGLVQSFAWFWCLISIFRERFVILGFIQCFLFWFIQFGWNLFGLGVWGVGAGVVIWEGVQLEFRV